MERFRGRRNINRFISDRTQKESRVRQLSGDFRTLAGPFEGGSQAAFESTSQMPSRRRHPRRACRPDRAAQSTIERCRSRHRDAATSRQSAAKQEKFYEAGWKGACRYRSVKWASGRVPTRRLYCRSCLIAARLRARAARYGDSDRRSRERRERAQPRGTADSSTKQANKLERAPKCREICCA